MEKTILIILMALAIQSCGPLQDYNDPTSTKQIAWSKIAEEGKFYINHFRVTKDLYKSVKIGDQFKMTKHTYLYEMKQHKETPTKDESRD